MGEPSDLPDPPARNSGSEPPLPAAVGRYEVVRLLGEGAMGRVLLAHDPVLDRDVAVKHLRGDLKIPREVKKGLLARMEHEARAAARVAHPNLVVLHDMGEDPAVGLYLVFEYVAGPTLKQRIQDRGRLPPAEAGRLARELSGALTMAHEAGILHRDVKPENIILSRTGGKLADFGIARIPDSTLTHQGGLMGTPAYSAPETFRAGKFSPASDQFSLAASIYEALSGKRAFPGDDAVAVAARISQEPPDPIAAGAGLPPAVDSVLSRALARPPGDRFPTCEAFGQALARSLSLPPAGEVADETRAAAIVPVTSAPPERRMGQVVLGGLLVVATAGLVVRTALRSAESGPDAAGPSPVPPALAASSATGRPRPPPPPVRTSRPRADPGAQPSPSVTAPAAASAMPTASAATAHAGSAAVPVGGDPPSPPAPAMADAGAAPPGAMSATPPATARP